MLRARSTGFGVVARMRGLPEKADELRGRLQDLMGLTRHEAGCISCEMIENGCDSTEFTLLLEWSDEASHNAHFGTKLIQNAMQFLPKLLSRDLDLRKRVLRWNSVRYGTNSYCLSLR